MKGKKKLKPLLIMVGVMMLLTIITTTAIGNTFAKFVSRVSAGGGAKSAGFVITSSNNSSEVDLTTETIIAPGESKEISLDFSYYSQVTTEFKETTEGSSVEGIGALETSFATLQSNYTNTWLPKYEDTYSYVEDTSAPASLSEMFIIEFTEADNIAEACANEVRTKGNLGGSGNIVNAMSKDATSSISCSITAKITWKEINDAWDTYIGNIVYDYITTNPTNPHSGVKVNIAVTAEQIVQLKTYTVTFEADSTTYVVLADDYTIDVEEGTLLRDIYLSGYDCIDCNAIVRINGENLCYVYEIDVSDYVIKDDIIITLLHGGPH